MRTVKAGLFFFLVGNVCGVLGTCALGIAYYVLALPIASMIKSSLATVATVLSIGSFGFGIVLLVVTVMTILEPSLNRNIIFINGRAHLEKTYEINRNK